jgi:hypothetical protein
VKARRHPRGAFPGTVSPDYQRCSSKKTLYLALQNASNKWKSIAAVCIDTSPGSAYGSATIYLSGLPGLGAALDHDRAARYPYRRACLPVNRLEDGSMFDW